MKNGNMENGGVLHLNELEYPSPKDDALCVVWLKRTDPLFPRGDTCVLTKKRTYSDEI